MPKYQPYTLYVKMKTYWIAVWKSLFTTGNQSQNIQLHQGAWPHVTFKSKIITKQTIVLVVSNQLQPPLSIAVSRNISELQKSFKVNTLPTFHRGSIISPTKKNKRIVCVDDFLMRGTEVPIFHQDFSFQHIFYLPTAQIQIKMERMTKFIGPANHRLFLLIHMAIFWEEEWRILGRRWYSPLVLPFEDKNLSRKREKNSNELIA